MKRISRHTFFASLLVSLTGCGLFGGPDTGSILDPAESAEARQEYDSLIRTAIHRAVVAERDIPDVQLLEDKSKILVSSRSSEGDTITADALPQDGPVEFVLADPEEIREMANDRGDFLYLRINAFEIAGEVGTISLSTAWAVAEGSDAVYLSRGGYQLQYRKADGAWTYEKTLVTWIS